MPLISPKKPIEVYLDSSDYSILSDKNNLLEKPELQSIYDELKKLVAEGLINIRYSAIIISEITHISERHKKYSIQRAKIIDELCGNKTFVDHLLLDKLDAENLIKSKEQSLPLSLSYAFNDNGDWFPSVSAPADEFLSDAIHFIQSKIKEQPVSRNEKYKLEKQLIINGKLSPQAVDVITNSDLNVKKYFSDQLPIDITLDLEKFTKLFLLGKISGEQLFQEIKLSFLDVVSFVEWVADNTPDITTWLRNNGEKNISLIYKLKEEIVDFKTISSNAGFNDKKTLESLKKHSQIYSKMREEILCQSWKTNIQTYQTMGITKDKWRKYILSSEIGELPSLDTYAQLTEIYMLNNILNNRKLKESDFGDLLHARYMPYVDLYRCDKYMKPLISEFSSQYKTNIISSLQELLPMIRSMINGTRGS